MELDARIKNREDIFDCFNSDKAEKYIGKRGYFSNNLGDFSDLVNNRPKNGTLEFGTLGKIHNNLGSPFYMKENVTVNAFFIPECFVKPKEKQYRPFTLNEFLHIYELGDIVTFKCKYNDYKHVGIVTGYETDKEGEKAIIHIGSYTYPLSVLFTDCERINSDGEWVPFGVEVEE